MAGKLTKQIGPNSDLKRRINTPPDDQIRAHIKAKLDALLDLVFNKNPWDDCDVSAPVNRFEVGSFFGSGSGQFIYLLTPDALRDLPDGTEVIGIFGDVKIKGVDYLDDDTRGAFTAWGLSDEEFA